MKDLPTSNRQLATDNPQNPQDADFRIKVVVGLGNPGRKYEGTRHNVGFAALDKLAAKNGQTFVTQPKWQLHQAKLGDVLLVKPQTFMNESGRAVSALCRFFKIEAHEILVVYDDVAFDPGIIKFKMGGSAGGHNGLKSLINHLGSQEFPRLKIGVGQPAPGELVGHVLSTFREEERNTIENALETSAEAVQLALSHGATAAANVYNVRKQPTERKQDE